MLTMDTFAHSVPEPTVTGRCRWFPRTRALRATPAERSRGNARRFSSAAFSLIEVAMAVGIMGFAFVAILGLVPVALTSFRTTKIGTVSSQISQQVIAQAQVAPFAALTQPDSSNQTVQKLTTPQGVAYTVLCLPGPPETPGAPPLYIRYFNDQGVEVLSTDPTGIYQVNSRVLVGPPFVQSTPSGGTGGTGGIGNADVAGLTVQVAYNPGRLTLDMKPNTDLWAGTANGGKVAVPLLSFPTNVARNF